ncbi:hypothetical protein D8I24_3846 [Cupriavidus necator H850]|nr:hypothetical protein D8I24_3846 [Cupriavidus necator H850]
MGVRRDCGSLAGIIVPGRPVAHRRIGRSCPDAPAALFCGTAAKRRRCRFVASDDC